MWKFVKKYKKDINEKKYPVFDKLVEYAIKYFEDIVKSKKKFKKPNQSEKKALLSLIKSLENCTTEMDPEEIQTIIYTVGKDNGFEENLREWFKLIYQVIFGDENGPRIGFFISFFGIKEMIELIKERIK